MDSIGQKRGCLNKRGIIDYDRVSRILLTELRAGKLGPITLETPEMMEQEKVEVVTKQAEKGEQREKRKAERKAKFRARQKENRRLR